MTIMKWGFGFAPQKKSTLEQRSAHISLLYGCINDMQFNAVNNICEAVSDVKGLFNRILRQDQWDWFTVYMYLGYPSLNDCYHSAKRLTEFRMAILNNDMWLCKLYTKRFSRSNFMIYLHNFLTFNPANTSGEEYIYIMSRRENKELLKIGMTTRNIANRVKEINSATGIVYPFSPRAIWCVQNGRLSERLVHQKLKDFRVREDREFFTIPFKDACLVIEETLAASGLLLRKHRLSVKSCFADI